MSCVYIVHYLINYGLPTVFLEHKISLNDYYDSILSFSDVVLICHCLSVFHLLLLYNVYLSIVTKCLKEVVSM
ncbi:hypothetical protein BT69DRAFT_311619 [Atractiella rhizophila]|nr:hypothetical protein BT69DRAFT_311619 [Atractiella rhizophila]